MTVGELKKILEQYSDNMEVHLGAGGCREGASHIDDDFMDYTNLSKGKVVVIYS